MAIKRVKDISGDDDYPNLMNLQGLFEKVTKAKNNLMTKMIDAERKAIMLYSLITGCTWTWTIVLVGGLVLDAITGNGKYDLFTLITTALISFMFIFLSHQSLGPFMNLWRQYEIKPAVWKDVDIR